MMSPDQALEILTDRKRAYQAAFGSPAGQAVLNDLAVFCRARETCVIPGDRDRTFVLEGRREVILRIRDHLDLSPEQLVDIHTRPAKGAHGHDDQDTLT
jgi:hypothetical protein